MKIEIDSLLVIDDTGMPKAPGIRQLIDKDVKELYTRDKSPNKEQYIKECVFIYNMGDPKSSVRQQGLSEVEAIKASCELAGLDRSYLPDALVIRLYKRYYDENITEAGRTVENILKSLHNINLSITKINALLNEKLCENISLEDTAAIIQNIQLVARVAGDIPATIDKLDKAKEKLLYEQEQLRARGGQEVVSSMDAENYQ